MKIGYARVSTQDQNLSLQLDSLKAAGCSEIYQEKISGKSKERPELAQMLAQLRAQDTVIVWKLDRLGRSLKDLMELVAQFNQLGVEFISLQEGINTTTATGRFTFNILASLAEFEREIAKDRTLAGLAAAKARGRHGGRPRGLNEDAKLKARSAQILYNDGARPVKEVAQILNISVPTVYRYLNYLADLNKKVII